MARRSGGPICIAEAIDKHLRNNKMAEKAGPRKSGRPGDLLASFLLTTHWPLGASKTPTVRDQHV
jgi:hypothetical protein